uniref:Hepcidin n=1 Tax=Poecilia reticulata TaxID=8081 RepID=A0A3P9PJR3_POERE
MKTFPLAAVAVTLVVAFICVQESDAAPAADVRASSENVGMLIKHFPRVFYTQIPFESARLRGHPHCRYCCACCPNKVGCGICCTF